MRAKDIVVGGHYLARVSRKSVVVRVTKVRAIAGGGAFGNARDKVVYDAVNLETDDKVTFSSAAKFQDQVR